MVGGFVHQEDVGAAEQHAGQGHAHFPAAGERADVAIDLVVLETESVEHFAGLGFERVAVQVLILFLHLAEAVQNLVKFAGAGGVFHGLLQRLELMVQITQAATAGDRFVEHGAAGHLFDVLPEVADGELLGERDVALVGLFFAHHHAEESGLASAVGAHQADLLTGVELEGGFDEDELFAVALVDVGERDHRILHASRNGRRGDGTNRGVVDLIGLMVFIQGKVSHGKPAFSP